MGGRVAERSAKGTWGPGLGPRASVPTLPETGAEPWPRPRGRGSGGQDHSAGPGPAGGVGGRNRPSAAPPKGPGAWWSRGGEGLPPDALVSPAVSFSTFSVHSGGAGFSGLGLVMVFCRVVSASACRMHL